VAKTLLRRNAALGRQFVQRIATDLEDAHDVLLPNPTPSSRSKTVRLLLALMNHDDCTSTGGSCFMALPPSRRDLASMLGSRQETLPEKILKNIDDHQTRSPSPFHY